MGLFYIKIHWIKPLSYFLYTKYYIFFFDYSIIWYISIVTISLLAGFVVASWGYYFKSSTPPNERIKTAADVMILSNILMIIINMVTVNLSPNAALTMSMLALFGVLFFATKLGTDIPDNLGDCPEPARKRNLRFPLFFILR